MVKTELVKAVAEKCGKSQNEVKNILDMALGVIADKVKEKEQVCIQDFGVFKPVYRAPRQTRNPQTGEVMMTEGKDTVTFKPYAKFFVYSVNNN